MYWQLPPSEDTGHNVMVSLTLIKHGSFCVNRNGSKEMFRFDRYIFADFSWESTLLKQCESLFASGRDV